MAARPPVDDTYLNDGLETTVRIFVWTHCLLLLGAEALVFWGNPAESFLERQRRFDQGQILKLRLGSRA